MIPFLKALVHVLRFMALINFKLELYKKLKIQKCTYKYIKNGHVKNKNEEVSIIMNLCFIKIHVPNKTVIKY